MNDERISFLVRNIAAADKFDNQDVIDATCSNAKEVRIFLDDTK
jgi:hypothetical protein